MNAGLYGLKFVLSYYRTGACPPLIRGLALSNRCNLRCRHCRIPERGPMDMDFAEVKAAVDRYYEEGGRCLYLEGGEPFLWRDGRHHLEDVVIYARERGYLTVVVYTNGTQPLLTTAETIFVSLDGLRETHDALRGESFDRILENIRDSVHPSIFVNFTINQVNQHEIAAFCAFIRELPQVRGIFFYFHTPYDGQDDLYLDDAAKGCILRELLVLRKRYRILNSRAGLLAAMRNDWKRPLAMCSVYEHGTVYPCCRFSGDEALCGACGYLSYAEIDQVLKLRPSAIYNAFKYF